MGKLLKSKLKIHRFVDNLMDANDRNLLDLLQKIRVEIIKQQ